MLAALAERYRPAGYDTGGLLRMSYYTAPNELDLSPFAAPCRAWRQYCPTRPRTLRDDQTRTFVLLSIVTPRSSRPLPRPIIRHRLAGKIFAEQLPETDPAYLEQWSRQKYMVPAARPSDSSVGRPSTAMPARSGGCAGAFLRGFRFGMEPAPRGWTVDLQCEESACAGSLNQLFFSHLI